MEFIRKTVRVGNSAGVILPKRLLGSEVKITVVKRAINIKKEVMKLVDDYLPDLRGIFLTNDNPLEVIAISNTTKQLIGNERIKLSIVPLSIIKRDIKIKQELKNKIMKAKPILNKALLFELKKEI